MLSRWRRVTIILGWLLSLQCATLAGANHIESHSKHVSISRAAFVFAGSARSFVMPTLHELLRHNLIAAFCPPDVRDSHICIADVFVRLSTSDNNHQGASAVGIYTQGTKEVLDRANAALLRLYLGPINILNKNRAVYNDTIKDDAASLKRQQQENKVRSSSNRKYNGIASEDEQYARSTSRKTIALVGPDMSYGVVLNVQYVDIGSTGEMAEMMELEKKARVTNQKLGAKHKIYRSLDPRRYSMYFHRWTAYKMALDREKQMGFRYDWVVHGRLDALWGSPVEPHYQWKKNGVYVHDSWYSDVPDTFAFLPREFSTQYYSLEALLADGAFCLGGPNFDPKTVKQEYLQRRFDDFEIAIIRKDECLKRFPNHIINYDKAQNITWSQAGTSEFLLKRKLDLYSIMIAKRNLILKPFFTALVRYPYQASCFYVGPGHFIPWVENWQKPVGSMNPGCRDLEAQANNYQLSPCDLLLPKDKWDRSTNPYIKLADSQIFTPERLGCIADKRISDLNFLPFRIRVTLPGTAQQQQQHRNTENDNVNSHHHLNQYCADFSSAVKAPLQIASSPSPLAAVPGGTASSNGGGGGGSTVSLSKFSQVLTSLTLNGQSPHRWIKEAEVVNVTECVPMIKKYTSYTYHYSTEQLFSMFPLVSTPQRITVYPLDGRILCLTVVPKTIIKTSDKSNEAGDKTAFLPPGAAASVVLAACSVSRDYKYQLFRIERLASDRIPSKNPCSSSSSHNSNDNDSDSDRRSGECLGGSYLGLYTPVVIKWDHNPLSVLNKNHTTPAVSGLASVIKTAGSSASGAVNYFQKLMGFPDRSSNNNEGTTTRLNVSTSVLIDGMVILAHSGGEGGGGFQNNDNSPPVPVSLDPSQELCISFRRWTTKTAKPPMLSIGGSSYSAGLYGCVAKQQQQQQQQSSGGGNRHSASNSSSSSLSASSSNKNKHHQPLLRHETYYRRSAVLVLERSTTGPAPKWPPAEQGKKTGAARQ